MKIILLLVTGLHCLTLCAQSKADLQLSSQLDSLITASLPPVAPGCAILIAKNNQIIYQKAFGMADLELGVPMRSSMVFRLGSVTKQFTAVAILQLAEAGKLSLQDSIQRFISDFPFKGHTVTIENLLTHTSGIIDYLALNTTDANAPFLIRKDFEPGAVVDLFKNEPLLFEPGTKYSYSNSNYFLLGVILEKITGKRFHTYLEENVLKPAGLTHTYYDNTKDIIPERARGYAGEKGNYQNADFISMSIAFAAGALASNTGDMLRWHLALYSGKLIRLDDLKKATTSFRLKNDSSIEYGYGWQIRSRDGSKSIEHSGAIDGFQSIEIYLPEPDIYIVALYNALNSGGDDPAYMGLTNDVATLAVGKPLTKEIRVPDSIMQNYVGVYAFDPKHKAYITLENGELEMEAPQGGLPKSRLFAKTTNIFFLKIINAEVEFVSDANGKVIQLITRYKGKKEVSKKIR